MVWTDPWSSRITQIPGTPTHVNVLDTYIKVEDNFLHTDLYLKPTDTHMYLHYSSCHPKHSKSGGPYSQLLLIRCICSKLKDFSRHATSIIHHYQQRGYPLPLLIEKLNHILQKDRQSLLNPPKPPTDSQAEQNLFCVVTYHPRNPPMLDILRDNWNLLECTPTLKCISEKQPKLGCRHNPNIRDLLVHSRITYPPTQNTRSAGGTSKSGKICVSTNCHYCPHLEKSEAWWSFTTNQKYIVPSRISCKLNNLVYMFTCARCGLQYVGETSRSLATRMSEHLCDVRHEANPDQANLFLSNKKVPPQ